MKLSSAVRHLIKPRTAASGSSVRWKDIARGIEDAFTTLRWCRKHLQEQRTSGALRLAQMNLSHLALALDSEMEGEQESSAAALRAIWWRAHVAEAALILEVPERGC